MKFDLWNGTTGMYTNGETPYEPQTTINNVDLSSGNPIACTLSYDGSTLKLSMKDTVSSATFSTSWSVDIPSAVGADTAYVGFTASLYTGPSQQDVTAWTFADVDVRARPERIDSAAAARCAAGNRGSSEEPRSLRARAQAV